MRKPLCWADWRKPILNDCAETVEWKFIEVVDIYKISSMEDGDQLFSATQEPIDADAYIEEVKMKSQKSFALAKSIEMTSMIPMGHFKSLH